VAILAVGVFLFWTGERIRSTVASDDQPEPQVLALSRESSSRGAAVGEASALPSADATTPEAPAVPTETPRKEGEIAFSASVIEPNYVVQAGDTLEAIARRHGTTVEVLVGLNNLADRNTLQVGQRLVVP